MARLIVNKPLDLVNLGLSFPVGGTPTESGFKLFSGTGWRLNVDLTGMDIATDFRLYQNPGTGFEQNLEISDINRPVVFPIGGPIQFILQLVLERADRLTGSSGDDGLTGYKGADTIRGKAGADTLIGARGDDALSGGSGQDRLLGGKGNDHLHGKSGHDVLFGGAGVDELHGGAGADRIRGGQGNDLLTGGVGGDTFLFRFGDGRDTIIDFEAGTDAIRIGNGDLDRDDVTLRQGDDYVSISFADVKIIVENVTVAEIDNDSSLLF